MSDSVALPQGGVWPLCPHQWGARDRRFAHSRISESDQCSLDFGGRLDPGAL